MYEREKQILTEYLKPKGNVFLLVLGLIMLFCGVMSLTVDVPLLASLLFLGVGGMLFVLALNAIRSFPRYIQSLEESGQMQPLLLEFSQSRTVYNDNLRFGYHNLFAKGFGSVLPYSDIVRVYQYIHRTNFVEDRRELKIINRKGQELTLCQLKTRGKSDNDVRQIIGMLLYYNSSIQVGYQK